MKYNLNKEQLKLTCINLSDEIKKDDKLPQKIFLTTERGDRISNIKSLIDNLKSNGFIILNPKNENTKSLLMLIKSAKTLITEKSSILNNIHIIRNTPYYVLSSNTENNYSQGLFHSAGMYRQFHKGLEQKILCVDDPFTDDKKKIQNDYKYKMMNSKRIKVDIDKVIDLIKSL